MTHDTIFGFMTSNRINKKDMCILISQSLLLWSIRENIPKWRTCQQVSTLGEQQFQPHRLKSAYHVGKELLFDKFIHRIAIVLFSALDSEIWMRYSREYWAVITLKYRHSCTTEQLVVGPAHLSMLPGYPIEAKRPALQFSSLTLILIGSPINSPSPMHRGVKLAGPPYTRITSGAMSQASHIWLRQ